MTQSSVEDEYRILPFTIVELTRITYLFREIGITLSPLLQLFNDNISALHMTINPIFHSRINHIELDYHFT